MSSVRHLWLKPSVCVTFGSNLLFKPPSQELSAQTFGSNWLKRLRPPVVGASHDAAPYSLTATWLNGSTAPCGTCRVGAEIRRIRQYLIPGMGYWPLV